MTSCSSIVPLLSAYLDAELAPPSRRVVEAHVAACASCAGVVRDLGRVRDAAATLGPMTPPAGVWKRTRQAIGATNVAPTDTPVPRRWQWIGAAAVVFAVVTAWLMIPRPARPAPDSRDTAAFRGNAAAADAVELTVVTSDRTARPYASALLELERADMADSATAGMAAMLRAQFETADRAIAASQAALDVDPESDAARRQLVAAIARKRDVMHATGQLLQALQRIDPERATQAAQVLFTKG